MRHIFRKTAMLFLAVVLFAPALVACSSGGKGVDGTAKAKIIRASFNFPLHIDPAVGSDYVASAVFCNVYDTLVFPKDDGTVKAWLAESWSMSADGLTYTFKLRKDVKFHSGNPLTAEDVVFSMDRMRKIGEGYGYLFIPYVEQASAPDQYTVVFRLKKQFGPFISALVRLYVVDKKLVTANLDKASSTYGDMYDYGKGYLLAHDAGSGPYKVKEFKTAEQLTVTKFTEYWQPFDPNNPDTFQFIGNWEPVTVRTLIARRELEITDITQPEENLKTMTAMPGVSLAVFKTGAILNLMMNTKKAPTDDVHFRRALAYAFDYNEAMTKIVPGASKTAGPVSSGTPGANVDMPQFTRDLEKAKGELKLSKYANELDKYEVELQYLTSAMAGQIALLFQANCADIGVKVKLSKTPWLTLTANVSKRETTANVSQVEVSPHYAEAGSMLASRYHSKSTGTWEQAEWLQNAEIDKAIEDALGTLDYNVRMAKYKEIQSKILELAPTIWIFDKPEKHAYQSAYVDWPAAKAAASGAKTNPVMGYLFYIRDMKVYPDKIPAPAGTS